MDLPCHMLLWHFLDRLASRMEESLLVPRQHPNILSLFLHNLEFELVMYFEFILNLRKVEPLEPDHFVVSIVRVSRYYCESKNLLDFDFPFSFFCPN